MWSEQLAGLGRPVFRIDTRCASLANTARSATSANGPSENQTCDEREPTDRCSTYLAFLHSVQFTPASLSSTKPSFDLVLLRWDEAKRDNDEDEDEETDNDELGVIGCLCLAQNSKQEEEG